MADVMPQAWALWEVDILFPYPSIKEFTFGHSWRNLIPVCGSNFLICLYFLWAWQLTSFYRRHSICTFKSLRSDRVFAFSIVNRGDWLWNPANIKGANKDAKIYVGRSTTVHKLLFCVHTLCMNVTNTFLLVSSSGRSKQILCFILFPER